MSNRAAYYGGLPDPSESPCPRPVSHSQHHGLIPAGGQSHNESSGNPYELQLGQMNEPDSMYHPPMQRETVVNHNFNDFNIVASSYPYGQPMNTFFGGSAPFYYLPNNHPGGMSLSGYFGYNGHITPANGYTEWSTNDYSSQMDRMAISDGKNDEISTGDARSSSNESAGKSRRFSRQRNIRENTESSKSHLNNMSNTPSHSKHEIRFSHQRNFKAHNPLTPKTANENVTNSRGVTRGNSDSNSTSEDNRFSIIRSIGKREIDTGFKDAGMNESKKQASSNAHKSNSYHKTKHQKSRKCNADSSNSQIGRLLDQLTSGSYECMVCCDRVKQQHAIWNCEKCYHVFHMGCIKKWARSPAAFVESEGWRCPGCRNVNKKYPNTYFCFCGKVKEPEWNHRETPHSCGEVCGKKRSNNESCIHPCNILCHPGPCPPCPASVIKNCLCGKMTRKVRCSQQNPLTCLEQCGKKKNCGLHVCALMCHDAECNVCDVLVAQICFCGKSVRNVPCGSAECRLQLLDGSEGIYSCEKICGKELLCGSHKCGEKCHSGVCKPCPLTPSEVTTCPCTQTKISDILDSDGNVIKRTSCLDPIPQCDQICGKPLECGGEDVHTCQLKCHKGVCPTCADKESTIRCRCGKSEKDVSCAEIPENKYICDRRCNKKRKCGRHKCGKTCCTDTEHACTQLCGRKLQCKLHRCEEMCHRGNCHSCYNVSFDELTCLCGAEVLYPPIPCGTKPPECSNSCMRQHRCLHPVNHNCHNEEKCPPCVVLVKKKCNCGRMLRSNIPCHQENVSCGAPCKKQLSCGHHCLKPCHQGPCMDGDDKCHQPCSVMRVECIHPCANPCHHPKPCPSTACKAIVTLRCNCGNLEKQVECSAGGATHQRITSEAFARQQHMSATNSVDISSLFHSASKQKILPCNEDCSAKERNRRLAEALNIVDNDEGRKFTQYSSFLQSWAKRDIGFVRNIEQELTNLVEAVEWLEKNKRDHMFPSMIRDKRQVIHELAEIFNCKSLSLDEEPNRSVLVTAVRGASRVPRVLPSESLMKSPDITSAKHFVQQEPALKPPESGKRLLSSMKLVSLTSHSPSGQDKTLETDLKRPASIPKMPSYPSSSKSSNSEIAGKSYKSLLADVAGKQDYSCSVGQNQSHKSNSSRHGRNKPSSNPFQHPVQIFPSARSAAASSSSGYELSMVDEPEIDYFDMTG